MGKLNLDLPDELHRLFKSKTSAEGKTMRQRLVELIEGDVEGFQPPRSP